MLAVSLDNLLFFLLIAVAALFQLLSKSLNKTHKKGSNETKQQTSRPIQQAPRESDADRIRKFLEALGQPPGSPPPPPALSRTDIPPRPVAPVQPPPVIIPGAFRLPRERRLKPDAAEREIAPIEQPSRFREIVRRVGSPTAAPVFELHEKLSLEPEQPSIVEAVEASALPKVFEVTKLSDSKMNIAALLGSKTSLRGAILVREILGPPRGLQALDAV